MGPGLHCRGDGTVARTKVASRRTTARGAPRGAGVLPVTTAMGRRPNVKLLLFGVVLLSLLAFVGLALTREVSGARAGVATRADAPRPAVPTARPALTAAEEAYAQALWPIHNEVKAAALKMSMAGIQYLTQGATSPLGAQVDATIEVYQRAERQILALQPPPSFQAHHDDYVRAVRLYQQAALRWSGSTRIAMSSISSPRSRGARRAARSSGGSEPCSGQPSTCRTRVVEGGGGPGGVRGPGRVRLGVASGRYLDGQGQDGGDLVGPNPTDRAKPGVKRSLLVEAGGGPLGVIVAGANVPDAKLLAATIEAVVLERPPVEEGWPQHLCLDKAYDNEDGWGACVDHDYLPHIALIRDERPPRPKRHKARRWVVETTQPHYP